MPAGRPRNNAKHLHAAVNGLVTAMEGLLATLGARGPKLPAEMRHPARPAKSKLGSAIKSSWANYTPAQRAARIAAMRAGHAKRKRALAQRGDAKPARKVAKPVAPTKSALAARKVAKQPAPNRAASPKTASPKATPTKPAPAARKSAWASMSPEQRAERIAKMKARLGGGTPAAT